MATFKSFICADDTTRVSAAVAAAEGRTSGEIVPMIVRRSSVIGHVPLQMLSFWIVVVMAIHISCEYFIYDFISQWWLVAFGVIGAPLAWFGARFECVQRALVPESDAAFEVMERAQLEFNAMKMRETKARTGILIFLSVMEHRCVVLADEGIASRLPPETWQDVVALVIDGVKRGMPAEGLIAAVGVCGDLLAKHFPAGAGDKNELPNGLIVKE